MCKNRLMGLIMIDKEAAFAVIICSALSFIGGIFVTATIMANRLPSPEQCLDMQQRLEQRIVDDKKSLELLKKTEK